MSASWCSHYCCTFWYHHLWPGDITAHCLSCSHHPGAAERTYSWKTNRENIGISSIHESENKLLPSSWSSEKIYIMCWKHQGRFPAVLVKTTQNWRLQWLLQEIEPGHKAETIGGRHRGNVGLESTYRWGSLKKNKIFYNASGMRDGGTIWQKIPSGNTGFSSGPES